MSLKCTNDENLKTSPPRSSFLKNCCSLLGSPHCRAPCLYISGETRVSFIKSFRNAPSTCNRNSSAPDHRYAATTIMSITLPCTFHANLVLHTCIRYSREGWCRAWDVACDEFVTVSAFIWGWNRLLWVCRMLLAIFMSAGRSEPDCSAFSVTVLSMCRVRLSTCRRPDTCEVCTNPDCYIEP